MQENNSFQNDLFNDESRPRRRQAARQGPLAKKYQFEFQVSYEQAAFCVIIALMALVLVFSLGVERGKRALVTARDQAPEKEQAATPVPEPVAETPKPAREPEIPKEAEKKAEKEAALPKPKPTAEIKPAQAEDSQAVSMPYTIQVATYWSKANAAEELVELKKMGLEPFMISNNNKYEVCVGKYPDKPSAAESLQELKKNYKDCFLRRR